MFSAILVVYSYLVNLNVGKYIENIFNSIETANILQSSIHSLILVLGTCQYLYSPNTLLYLVLKYYSIGHLIWDSYYFHYLHNVNGHKNIYIFHHIFFIMAWLVSYNYDKLLFFRLLLSEITVIPLNIKMYYKNKNNKKKEFVFSLLTYGLFFQFRIVNFSYHYYIFMTQGYYLLSLLFIPITSLQYYWFYLMTLKAIKMIKTKPK